MRRNNDKQNTVKVRRNFAMENSVERNLNADFYLLVIRDSILLHVVYNVCAVKRPEINRSIILRFETLRTVRIHFYMSKYFGNSISDNIKRKKRKILIHHALPMSFNCKFTIYLYVLIIYFLFYTIAL